MLHKSVSGRQTCSILICEKKGNNKYDTHYSDCPPKFDGKCLTNGTAVLQSYAYNTDFEYVFFDYLGLTLLAFIMHMFAFIGIRRNTKSVGYY